MPQIVSNFLGHVHSSGFFCFMVSLEAQHSGLPLNYFPLYIAICHCEEKDDLKLNKFIHKNRISIAIGAKTHVLEFYETFLNLKICEER